MNTTNQLLKKFISAAGLQVLCKGLSVVSGIVLARYLGPEQYGLYTFVLSIISVAMMLVVAGLPQLLIREVANAELESNWGVLNGLFRWSTNSVLVLSVFIMLTMLGLLWSGAFDPDVELVLWTALVLIPIKSLSSKQGAIINGLRSPILAIIPESVVMPVVALCFYLGFILLDINFTAMLMIETQIVTAIVTFLCGVIFLRRVRPKELTQNRSVYHVKKWYVALLPFTVISLLGTMNVEISSVLLGIFGESEAVGYFKVALQGVMLVTLGLTAIDTITGPNIARLYKSGDLHSTQILLSKSVRLTCLVSIPIVIFLFFFGELVVTLLFGKEYVRSATILNILCIGQIVNALMGSSALVLNMTGNENKSLKALFYTFLINAIGLAVLVPNYGDVGAAASVSLSVIFWNLFMAKEVHKSTGLKTWFRFGNQLTLKHS
ncbi:flippase [Vibrio europaeus]|uniref:flippase n=1 Tax=Vibrio europaeus TaxID=300876 RepID=UPI0039E1C578